MTRLTNYAPNHWDFTTGSKNGEPIIDALMPGETKDIDLPVDDPQILAVLNTTLVVVAERGTPNTAKVAARKADEPTAS